MTEEGDPHHSPNRVTFAEGYSLVMADGTFPANAGSTEQTKQCRGQTKKNMKFSTSLSMDFQTSRCEYRKWSIVKMSCLMRKEIQLCGGTL